METKFNSQEELFNKVKPALRTKKHDLERIGVMNIDEKDIWEYNKLYKWRHTHGLTLASMVDDILNTNDREYIEYVINKINTEKGENINE